jgi:hypothetical protein
MSRMQSGFFWDVIPHIRVLHGVTADCEKFNKRGYVRIYVSVV